ncbi:hypothetical protein P9112_007340 [Eukaryota sp. TZLM1-RC]
MVVLSSSSSLVSFPDGTTYTGSLKNKVPHGYGILSSPDGSRYEGNFCLGKKEGYGTFTTPNFTYMGEFLCGLFDGEGQIDYKDGRKYTGLFKFGMKNGFGRLEFNDNIYEGFFLKDKYHGNGIFKSSDGTIYEGSFHHGGMEGEGKITWPCGVCYEGVVHDGGVVGQGTLATGENTLEGTLGADGLLTGYGSRSCFGGALKLAGTHVCGKLQGQGTIETECFKYSGHVHDDVIDGKGSMEVKRPNGEVIKIYGDFVQNRFITGDFVFEDGSAVCILNDFERKFIMASEKEPTAGECQCIYEEGNSTSSYLIDFADGRQYEGQVSDKSLNGFGQLSFPNGDVYKGEFSNGLFHGNGQYTWANGTVFVGEFYEGNVHGKGMLENSDLSIGKYTGEFSLGCVEGEGVVERSGRSIAGKWVKGELIESAEV